MVTENKVVVIFYIIKRNILSGNWQISSKKKIKKKNEHKK